MTAFKIRCANYEAQIIMRLNLTFTKFMVALFAVDIVQCIERRGAFHTEWPFGIRLGATMKNISANFVGNKNIEEYMKRCTNTDYMDTMVYIQTMARHFIHGTQLMRSSNCILM